VSGHAMRFAAAALLSLAACAPRYPYTLATGHAGAPGVQTLALLPLNLVIALPSELESPVERVSDQIEAYLKERGKGVLTLGMYDSRQRWVAAVSQAKQAGPKSDFETAAKILVESLRERQAFDALVMPSLVYRNASMQGGSRSAVWDGVKRQLKVIGEKHMHTDIYLMNSFHGKISAVSLHLLVYDAQGQRVFERFGGLDLAHEADVSGSDFGTGSGWQLRVRPDALEDAAALREGVRIAFTPYLPPPTAAAPGGS
jgi:hypothetical protein